MKYSEIVSRFTVKRSSGNKSQCICPAHDDREASLTISQGDGKTLIHCHANCDPEAILSAVGLTMKDLFDGDQIQTGEKWRSYVENREKRKIEDVYNYVGLNGEYAFSRIRLSGKKFLYGRFEGDRFVYGLNGKSRNTIPAVYCNGLEGVRKAIADGKRIFYCEGEKDVKTVNSHGLTGITCGASGDWNDDCKVLFAGADVVILSDNDRAGKESSRKVERSLQGIAKSVRIIVPTPDLEKGDISDFFQDHTVEDLEALMKKSPEREDLDLDQFHLISDQGKVTGVFDYAIFDYIRKHNDLFVLGNVPYLYEDGVYRADRSGAKLKTLIRELIYPEFIKSTTIKRIFDLFLSDSGLQVSAEDLNNYPAEWICFKNGFYDPIRKAMYPHDPKYRTINQIPHSFLPEGKPTGANLGEWLKFITPDKETEEMLKQFAGLCMTRDTRQQKFLILNGEGGSGKSTLIRLIELMIGTENISNISLSQLSQRFSAYGLLGKLLNSCADLELTALEDTSVLKKCLGEDVLFGEAKGKDGVSFKSYAKLIFSTNELPIVKGERTNGFYRRLLIIPMNRVPEKKDSDFFGKIAGEIDWFIMESVHALERMYEAGRITESAESIEAVKTLRCESDTVEAFLTDKTVRDPEGRVRKPDLYRSYENYCQDLDRQSLTKQNFFRSMKAKGIGTIKTGGIEYFKGIFLPKTSPQFSPSQFINVTGQPTPFDQGENGEK